MNIYHKEKTVATDNTENIIWNKLQELNLFDPEKIPITYSGESQNNYLEAGSAACRKSYGTLTRQIKKLIHYLAGENNQKFTLALKNIYNECKKNQLQEIAIPLNLSIDFYIQKAQEIISIINKHPKITTYLLINPMNQYQPKEPKKIYDLIQSHLNRIHNPKNIILKWSLAQTIFGIQALAIPCGTKFNLNTKSVPNEENFLDAPEITKKIHQKAINKYKIRSISKKF